ncbi:MAG TPA: hypothetical protein VGM44_20295 [Polyangiaceae bacterium]|jgi:hypothetical protein
MVIFKKTKAAYWLAGVALVGVSLCAGAALHAATTPSAPVPASLTQQGRILDSNGMAVSSKLAIVFTIYDDPTASADSDVLWTETQNIALDDGYYSTQLGADPANAFPAGTFDGSVRYLGVQVGSDAEMKPRQAITSVPYALQAAAASTATNAENATGALATQITTLQGQSHAPSAFRATLSPSKSVIVPNNASLTVAFDQVEFDLAAEYNATTGVFTAKQAGIYQLHCSVEFETGATGDWAAEIIKNNGATPLAATDLTSNAIDGLSPYVGVVTKLNAGDTLVCLAGSFAASDSSAHALYAVADRNSFSAARLY